MELTKVNEGYEDNALHNYQLIRDRAWRNIRKPMSFDKANLIYYGLGASVEPNFNEPTMDKEDYEI